MGVSENGGRFHNLPLQRGHAFEWFPVLSTHVYESYPTTIRYPLVIYDTLWETNMTMENHHV